MKSVRFFFKTKKKRLKFTFTIVFVKSTCSDTSKCDEYFENAKN